MATTSKSGKTAASKPKVAPVKKTAAAKPKAAEKKPAAPAKKVAKPATARKGNGSEALVCPDDQRRHYIEVAAYYIAERRGFHGGSELEDWIAAEAEVESMLREGLLGLD